MQYTDCNQQNSPGGILSDFAKNIGMTGEAGIVSRPRNHSDSEDRTEKRLVFEKRRFLKKVLGEAMMMGLSDSNQRE